MDGKLQKVVLWLKKIHGEEYTPEFEMNARTISFLHELVVCNQFADKDASVLIQHMKMMERQYEANNKYLNNMLTESLHLSPSSLSSKGKSYIEVLADSAMILETNDTSLTSLFSAINGLTFEVYDTESKNKELALELGKMRRKLTAALCLEQQLKRDLEKTNEHLEVVKTKADSRCRNLDFLMNKSEDIKMRIKDTEKQLIAVELDVSLMHDAIIHLSEKLHGIQEEVESLKEEEKVLLDLPLNVFLAKVKTEELKLELGAIEAEFTKEVDKLTFEFM